MSIPAKILEIKNNNKAIADFGPSDNRVNKKQEVDIQLVKDIKVGDFALISNGFIIKKVSADEAEEIFKTIQGG